MLLLSQVSERTLTQVRSVGGKLATDGQEWNVLTPGRKLVEDADGHVGDFGFSGQL